MVRQIHTAALLAGLVLAACSSAPPVQPPQADPPQAETPRDPVYSPFVVEMSMSSSAAPLAFSVISFKDVGMSIQPDERAFEYELLAESVAQGLAASFAESGHATSVRHAPEITDPAVHVACDSGHIYVDVWDAENGAGYSLWSGCGEDDQFAHRELASNDASVLARDIAEQIRRASDTGCFTLHC